MGTGVLTFDTAALAENWRALDAMTACETGAVVKAGGYGLGAESVARGLAAVGARSFFVATAEEGAELRGALGAGPAIHVLSGHMEGDAPFLRDGALVPAINSAEQMSRHLEALPDSPFALQLDSGMNRLGVTGADLGDLKGLLAGREPALVMSHLACADDPGHPMNPRQLREFNRMAEHFDAPRSLAATGGMLLGPDYHLDLCRPGIGLYGGAPFAEARPVVSLDLPVVQVRVLEAGDSVGYGADWTASGRRRVAAVAAGYADGLFRSLGSRGRLWHGAVPCPILGRVSMDLVSADVTALNDDDVPETLAALGPHQGIDDLAEAAGTIGHEILAALGARYARERTGPRASAARERPELEGAVA